MHLFWTAFKFLATFPSPRRVATTPQEIGRSAPFFPLVGLCLGLVLVLLNQILEPYLESEILGVVLVSFLILLTRAQHLEGLRESFDRIGSGGGGEGVASNRIGISGILAVMVVIMLKFRAIEVMGEVRSQGLLLAPVLSRWSMVILAYGFQSVQDGMGRILMEQVGGRHLLAATTIALILVILMGGRPGLWIALWVSILTLSGGWHLHRLTGGVRGDDVGAVVEICEAFVLVLFASF